MHENNDIFIGWSYVKALFDCLQELSDRDKKGQMVTPRYIFRGVTQRHFTSSIPITEYLDNHKDVVYKILHKDPQADKISQKQRLSAEKKFYEQCQTDLIRKICGQTFHDKNSALEQLRSIVGLTQSDYYETFKLIKPRFIRSGAAVRLYHQFNRTQYDYVAYLKNLINEIKSRYPGEYEGYSDLELLAELQHKGAATCLVDFSTNFLNSLWFATQDYANSEEHIGYVFCYDTSTDAIERNNLVFLNKDKEGLDIEKLIDKTTQTLDFQGKPLCRFFLWKPSNLNSRIARQDSVFVFGIEKFEVEKHPVFILPIPPHWKEPIQRALKDFFGITGETLYADAAGVATANTKTNPLKTQTKYFNEEVLKPQAGKILGFDSMDIFQKGTSALLKAQYQIDLDYFGSFEGSNYHRIAKLYGLNHGCGERYRNLVMLMIELHYSKGLCLRHLNKHQDSIRSYDMALDKCFEILAITQQENTIGESIRDEIGTHTNRYVIDKLFKIIEDYVDMLFDIHAYKFVDRKLGDFIERYTDVVGELSPEMALLLLTARNEARVLNRIWLEDNSSKTNLTEYNTYESVQLIPFCKVLNVLYLSIDMIISKNLCYEDYAKTELYNKLEKAMNDAVQKQDMSSRGKQEVNLFVAWDLGDIKTIVNEKMDKQPIIRDAILRCTAEVEDCRRRIEGRKRQETY